MINDMNLNKPKIIAVIGPTASGKTALSVNIARAFNGEVVSADSMQIYKGMDIATAKPIKSEMAGIRHYLIDFLPVGESFSVAAYVELAHKAVRTILSRGKLPIIAGGTGLYVDNLLSGTVFSEGETDLKLRAELSEKLQTQGLDSLLKELKDIDYLSYEKLKVQRNPKRIIRALEIYKTTGITMSRQNELSKPEASPYEAIKIGIDFKDRQKLYNRINTRVDMMLEAGLLDEARNFFTSNVGCTAVQAIGYKELEPYFKEDAQLSECIEALKRSTRRYAKRQLTWFRKDDSVNWFFADEYESANELFKAVEDYLIFKGFEKK